MITDIQCEEKWNMEANTWDSIITWKYNDIPNKVVCSTKGDRVTIILKSLIDKQIDAPKIRKVYR